MSSVERVLCDKCGSPTNMSVNYAKAPSERLQSAPAYRGVNIAREASQ